MQSGIYQNLSNKEYHADKNSISRSALMDFRESPFRYWANHINPDRPAKEPTPAMIFGSAFHTRVLEPYLFLETYIVKPEPMLLKDVGRELYEKYKIRIAEIESSKKIVLSINESCAIFSMYLALKANKQAMELIEGAIYEQSYFWQDKETGLMVKARPDILHENMIVDLKTCADASPKAFQRAMVAGGYHYQGAMIQDAVMALEGRFIDTVINIAIEKTYPYSIGIYIIGEEALNSARIQYKELLCDMKKCIENDSWPDFEVQTIELPTWAN